MVDFDKDGKQDLLIADLGDFMPGDHEKGSIVLAAPDGPAAVREDRARRQDRAHRRRRRPPTSTATASSTSWSAAFGWHTVGGIFVYENQTTDWKQPKFEGYPVDARPGGIHVPIVDLNKDGKPDFVALISQQYEHVVAFINRGAGKGFRAETIFRAVVPVWGSSGIELVDMDKDGDLDLLMSNGDSLDDFTVRPFHGVRWFENKGEYPWKQHDLAIMPGVHRAQAADIDGDGDLDVVRRGLPAERRAPGLPAARAAGQPRALHLARLARADEAGRLRPPPARDGQADPHDTRPRRLRRRRRRRHRHRQLRRLHVHEDRHRLQGRRHRRPVGESGEATGRRAPRASAAGLARRRALSRRRTPLPRLAVRPAGRVELPARRRAVAAPARRCPAARASSTRALGGRHRVGEAAGLGVGRGERVETRTARAPPVSRTARCASATASAPLRTAASGVVASAQAAWISTGRRPGTARSTRRHCASASRVRPWP